ncbi:hypothetical protein EMMF5_003948 [Cystobasidiomycetes sp. EMM_F5]
MTERGPVIERGQQPIHETPDIEDDSDSEAGSTATNPASSQQRGPIAEMLYSRWLEGLRRATGLY